MPPISIVILTKNEEQNIVRCLSSVKNLSDDVLVIDSGSTDSTIALAKTNQARVIETAWLGYSATKNVGNQQAKYDWILSLDADEELNSNLQEQLKQLFSANLPQSTAFMLQRKMVYAGVILNYGSVRNEFRIRLFNRNTAYWNQSTVHEDIAFNSQVEIQKLNGFVWHHSFSSADDHLSRLEKYAQLSAQQMASQRRKATFIKRYMSPMFGFIKNYIFKLGFLDGRSGLEFARHEMWYVQRKYELLNMIK